MRRVPRPSGTGQSAIAAAVLTLCDATQQETEAAADALDIVLPTSFVETRTLDLTGPVTADHLAAVFATFIGDLQRRGANRKNPNV